MRVFITGATGFVGSAVVNELIAAGHKVIGLARSEASTKALAAKNVEVLRGDLHDLESLRRGAAAADGVIHTAFIHDFNNYGPAADADQRAIEALGSTLAGSSRPLIVTSGTLILQRKGALATEDDASTPSFPRKSEVAAIALADRGVNASIVRLPPSVHGEGDHGFIPALIGIARDKRISACVGDGLNRWPAVHRLDAARLYRLVIEKGSAGGRYHGVGDEGVPTREIAKAIGRGLDIPVASRSREEAAGHFGWIGNFFAIDGPASYAQTRTQLGWQPTQPGLIDDLEAGHYFEQAAVAALQQ